MKSKLLKNSIKEIRYTFKRFISIFLMAFLGVGFFAGLVAAGPDMNETLDKFYDEKNMYDISILSTMGLEDEDISALKNLNNVENVYGINSKDQEVNILGENYVSKFIELSDDINKIEIIEGRNIENSNECILDSYFANKHNVKVGDKIKSDEKEYEIVGIAKSPLYITFSRGTTNIGAGSLDSFIYIDKIEQDYYTNIYLNVSGAEKFITNSKEYNDVVNSVKEEIEEIKSSREEARYNQIRSKAEDEINKAVEELEKNRNETNEKLSNAEKQITSGQNSISNAKTKLNNSKKELTKNKEEAKQSLLNAENEIKNNEEKLNELKVALSQANGALSTVNKNIDEIEENIKTLKDTKKQLESSNQSSKEVDEKIKSLEETKQSLNVQKTDIESKIKELDNLVKTSEAGVNAAKEQLNKAKTDTQNELNKAETQISSAQKEITQNEKKLSDSKEELNNNKSEAEKAFKEAEDKITDARKELAKIEKPTWYINLRTDNSGYSTFIDSVQSMINIAKIFPLVFYIIAILTSLTSMTRMVDEERLEIGTLKALGYTNIQILGKYIIYSLSACVSGGIIGMLIGFKMLPNIIWYIYKIIFDMTDFTAPFRVDIGLIGLGIAIACICGATILACMQVLKNMPAKLMRPKAPKVGKRIFLERINFIWKRLNFSQKVTTRNIFRYKKRAYMTIIGITGCTALILAGFGLKDSITGIVSYQYGEIFEYQELININDKSVTDLIDAEYIETNMKSINIEGYDANLLTADDDIKEVINLYDKKTNEIVNLTTDGILITEKLADLINIKEGENINLTIDDKEYSFKVEHILKNYIHNYVYISKPLYEEIIGEYETNTIIVKDKLSEENKKEILDNENVYALLDVSETISTVEDMLQSLNYVVIILIVSAALLAFVVLYNLANINIGERIREIATLKVLGFYDSEVDNYISKETRIFTAIGIIFGLFAGYILCNFLITTCEMEMCRFLKEIKPISYIYAILITVFFTFVVNVIVHKTLKKVDMIESLKSVE